MTDTTPLPGDKVRGSESGRPIMALLDLLGRRWTLRVLWELRAGPISFRDLQAACDGASPSVINTRLKELRESGLVDHTSGQGYALSTQGIELSKHFNPINDWANQWGAQYLGDKE